MKHVTIFVKILRKKEEVCKGESPLHWKFWPNIWKKKEAKTQETSRNQRSAGHN